MSAARTEPEIIAAHAEAAAARRDLFATIGEIQRRLRPATVAREAWAQVRETSAAAAETAASKVRERPAATAGIVGAAAALLLRRPLARLVRLAFSRRHETEADDDRFNPTSRTRQTEARG